MTNIVNKKQEERPKTLSEILQTSTFSIEPGIFIYSKARAKPKNGNHFMVSSDHDEVTVVTTEDNLRHVKVIERNKDKWKLIALNVSSPFYSVGFLAAVSDAIAKTGTDILAISTFSKDYVLVLPSAVETTKKALLSLGLKETARP